MRLRGLVGVLGVLSGLLLAACVVATNDGDRKSEIPNPAGSSGAGGTAGTAGSSAGGSAGSAGSAGSSDAATDVGSGGKADAAADAASDGAAIDGDTGVADGMAGTDSGSNDGGGSGGTGGRDGGDPSIGVQCNAIIAVCPAVALAQCQIYLAGLSATARAYVVSCMSTGCNFTSCLRDL